ncbi:hypothetical protein [Caballeronia glebae]|uniref:hypothetical protein n=1 Tax=Caballeronia glebae TaxID=1777143 RepID=UPI0011806E42|nr:hypothetical protein [Caballeronia glebae]
MTAAVSLVARQFTIERSTVQVVVDTTIAARLQGLSDALDHVPVAERPSLLSKFGFKDETALVAALSAQGRELSCAEQIRAAELALNDKRLAALLAACGFGAIVSIMGVVTIYDAHVTRSRRLSKSVTIAASRAPMLMGSACRRKLRRLL